MSKDAANIRIGECDVYLDDGSGEVLTGHTKGGVQFMFERELVDLTVDQYGENTPVDIALNGNDLKIKYTLAEPVTSKLKDAIPEGDYAESGSDSKLNLGRDAGYLLSDAAQLMRLHPRKNAASNNNEDIYIWKAVSVENIELDYSPGEQRLLEITMRALVDEDQPEGARLGRVGDFDIS